MKIIITEPTKAYLVDYSHEDLEFLSKNLSYRNTSIQFQLMKLKKNRWFKEKNFSGWVQAIKELESQIKTTLIFKEGDSFYIRPGSIPYLERTYQIENQVNYPKAKLIPWNKPLPFEPYSYQSDAVERLLAIKHGAVSIATGGGKSAILALLTKKLGLKTVIVVPSKSIFFEVLELFETHFGKSKVGAFGQGKKDIKKDITVAIGKSVTMIKPGTPEWEFMSAKQVLVWDESHLSGAEELQKACHGVLKGAPYRFFLSGTQTRGDGSIPLLQSITGPVVSEFSTAEGIEGGFLNKLEFRILPVQSHKPNYFVSDPMTMKRVHLLRNPNVLDVAAKIANSSANTLGESTLILVEEIDQIAELAKRLTVPFTYVHGGSLKKDEAEKLGIENRDMKEELLKFNNGEVKVLIGTDSISTGTNLFPTHNTINLQGGSSEISTKQGVIGRSVRLLSKSKFKDKHKPKDVSKIWDFDILNIDILEKQLAKRIGFYKETNCLVIKKD